MGGRLVLVLACALVVLPTAVPAAFAAVLGKDRRLPPIEPYGIETVEPAQGRAGTTVRVDVSGDFHANEQTPMFRLSLPGDPASVITGETVSFNVFTGSTATIRFVLPQDAAPGAYTLTAVQRGVALRATATFTVLPPQPRITALGPASIDALGRAFDLTVSGTGFSTASPGGSVVYWGETALTTTRDSAVQLTARVPAALIAEPGTVSVTVRNGSGAIAETSAPVQYSVLTPVPSVTSLSPDTAIPGGPAFELNVFGARFLTDAVVSWDQEDLVTRRVSAVLLKATVPASLHSRAGRATVVVRNGPFSMRISNEVTFLLAYPTPAITALSPNLVRAGGPAFDLEVSGARFLTGAGGSVVRWNDTDLVTTRASERRLVARVPAALTARAGAVDITVRNGPADEGALSGVCVFTVGDTPTITRLDPAGVQAGSGDLTLTVKGTHLLRSVAFPLPGTIGSVVEWNGEALATTWKSARFLQAKVPAAKLVAAGVARVTVRNVTEGTVSNSLAFTVTRSPVDPVVRPKLIALDPVWASSGGPGFDLGVTGTGFATDAAGAVVRWGATDLATTRDSARHLTAAVPAALLAQPGEVSITVRNGAAAAAPVSNALTFKVGAAPVLSVMSVEPSTLWAGCRQSDLVLTVNGAGFVSGARVVVDGEDKPGTTFVSAAILTVPIPVSAMARPGELLVGAENPPFPPGTAAAGSLPVAVVRETTDPVVSIDGADAGWHNAPVPLTIRATDDESGVYKTQYRSEPAVPSWRAGSSLTVPVTEQGAIVVDARAYDWCNRVGSATVTVNIDTTRPGTEALRDVRVKKGRTARLRYRVTEPAGLSPTADVVISVERADGTTAKTLRVADAPVNVEGSVSFACDLRKGRYTWHVYATDLAGNEQADVAVARLRVR